MVLVTVKWGNLSIDQSMDTSQLQQVIEAAYIHSRQTAVGRTVLCRIRGNMLASTVVKLIKSCSGTYDSAEKDCRNVFLQTAPQEDVMQSHVELQSTFLEMSHPTTASYIPHSALEHRHA
jgi:hypothetical protein